MNAEKPKSADYEYLKQVENFIESGEAHSPKLAPFLDEVRSLIEEVTDLPRRGEKLRSYTSLRIIDLASRSMQQECEAEGKNSDTPLAVLQEVLADPEDYREVSSVNEIMVSPLRISDTLLQNIGLLNQYESQKGSSYADNAAARSSLIPELKNILSELEPIPGIGTKKLYSFPKGHELAGGIYGTQMIAGKRRIFMTDAYNVKRRHERIDETYKKEVEHLDFIRTQLKGFDYVLARLGDEFGQAELSEAKEAMFTIVDELEHVSNEDKVALKKVIQKIVTLKDSMGRENIGVTRNATNIRAPKYTDARQKEIYRIESNLSPRRRYAAQFAINGIRPFDDFLDVIDRNGDSLHILNKEGDYDKAKAARLIEYAERCGASEIEPFRGFGKAIENYLTLAADKAQNSDTRKEGIELFTKAFVIAKLVRAMDIIQDAYDAVHSGLSKNVFIKSISSQLALAKKSLNGQALAPSVKTPEFDEAYGAVTRLLDELIKELNMVMKIWNETKDPDKKEFSNNEAIKTRLSAFKEKVKDFDFVTLGKNLPLPIAES